MKNNRIIHFLTISIVLIFVLCVFIFSFLAIFINRRGEDTINKIGTAYMTSMSEQVSLHFKTTIQLRLAQMDALVTTISAQKSADGDALRQVLAYNAEARGFEYLAFYSADGTFEMIDGEEIQVTDPERTRAGTISFCWAWRRIMS